jgi:hypothetical protein
MKKPVSQRQYRRLWGVTLRSPRSPEFLLFEPWDKNRPPIYHGEPIRPLVFLTRLQARLWAAKKVKKYSAYQDGICQYWRFRAVRVSELLLWDGR